MNAIIYARFSPRPGADESLSNANQEARCREYAAERGYHVAHVFADEGLTGMDDEQSPDPIKAVERRLGLCTAMDAVGPGMVLLVRWRSRISREPFILSFVERTITRQGGTVEASDESNATGLGAELERGVLATVSKYKVLEIRWQTSRAMRKHQAGGRRMTRIGREPWGTTTDPTDPARLIPVPGEIEVAKDIVRLRDGGVAYSAIAALLRARGTPKRNSTWDESSVRSIYRRFSSTIHPPA